MRKSKKNIEEGFENLQKLIDEIEKDSIFNEAESIVNGKRHNDYGDYSKNMEDISKVWSGIIGITITPQLVALCMAGLKLVREAHLHKRDNLVDALGYIHIANEISENEERA